MCFSWLGLFLPVPEMCSGCCVKMTLINHKYLFQLVFVSSQLCCLSVFLASPVSLQPFSLMPIYCGAFGVRCRWCTFIDIKTFFRPSLSICCLLSLWPTSKTLIRISFSSARTLFFALFVHEILALACHWNGAYGARVRQMNEFYRMKNKL